MCRNVLSIPATPVVGELRKISRISLVGAVATLAFVAGCKAASHHHIYKAGYQSNTCEAQLFHATYWTNAAKGKGMFLEGTAYAQKAIWHHQHPHDCSAVRFLLWKPSGNGLGSNFHVMGQVLANAIGSGRVLLLMHDPAHPYYDETYCADKSPSYHDCYFEPVSNCTLKDAERILEGGNNFDDLPRMECTEDDQPANRVMRFDFIPRVTKYQPPAFQSILEASAIDPAKYYYWWRAQSVAFLIRPNAHTHAVMHARMAKIYKGTIAEGTIACHIRHGDKKIEYPPVDDALYVKAAEEILGLQAGHELKRNIFLLTDDPKSVRYFKTLTGWNISFANVHRPENHEGTWAEAKKQGKVNAVINALIDLHLALQCDAWVGTLTSNWSRLIDELRSTVRCKADMIYWDAIQMNPASNLEWK